VTDPCSVGLGNKRLDSTGLMIGAGIIHNAWTELIISSQAHWNDTAALSRERA
jgi:hypothetical protein